MFSAYLFIFIFYLALSNAAPLISELPTELIHGITKYLNSTEAFSLRACSERLFHQISIGDHDPIPDEFKVLKKAVGKKHVDASKVFRLQFQKLEEYGRSHGSVHGYNCPSGIIRLAGRWGNLDFIKEAYNMTECKGFLKLAFHAAAASSKVDVVQFLMIRSDLGEGWWPIHGVYDPEVVKVILCDPKSDPGKNNNEAMQEAARLGKAEIVALLLNDSRVDPTDRDNEVLFYTLKLIETKILKLLLQDGRVDPGARNNLLLQGACRYGNVEVVEILLKDSRVDPSGNNYRPFRTACQWNQVACLRLMYNDGRGTPPDLSPLYSNACFMPDPSIPVMLFNDSRVNHTWNNCEAVFNACSSGSFRTFKMLLCVPEVNEHLNFTRLFVKATCTVRWDAPNLVKLLLAHPKIDPKFNEKEVLMGTCRFGSYDVFQTLLEDPRINVLPYVDDLLQCETHYTDRRIFTLLESLRSKQCK